jgi:hypothetical protein
MARKYCAPVHSTEKIEGFGMGPYGIGPFGASYLLIDLGAEKAPADRWLVASDMLREIVKFWDRFFEQYGPKPNATEKIAAGGK